jgi:hypothetical protein
MDRYCLAALRLRAEPVLSRLQAALSASPTPRWPAFVIACGLCLLAATGFWQLTQSELRADDDNLWLYFGSHKIAAPAAGQALEDEILAAARQRGAGEDSLVRLEQRRDYWLNYALPLIGWNRLQSVLAPPADIAAYPAYLGRAVWLMLAAGVAVSWLVLVAVLLALRDRRLLIAAGLAFGVAALFSLLAMPPNTQLLMDAGPLPQAVENVVAFVLDPRLSYSIFGFTPRNYIAVLAVAIFAMRWSGVDARWVYLLLLPLFGVHSSLALLLLVHLVALDLVRRRAVLRDGVVLLLIAIGAAYGLWRETLWPTIAGSLFIQIAFAAGLVLVLAVVWAPDPIAWLRRPWPWAWRRLNDFAAWLARQSPWTGDLLLLAFFWLVSFPLVWIISQVTSELQNYYFWHQLHGRAIGLLRLVVFFGVALVVVTRLAAPRWPAIVSALLLVWSLGVALTSRGGTPPWETFAAEASQLESALSGERLGGERPEAAGGFVFDEAVVYYTLGQMLTLDNDRRADLWRTAPTP